MAGRREILELLDYKPDEEWNRKRRVVHQGTFNGNPLSAAAGIASLKLASSGEAQRKADERAVHLRRGLQQVLSALKVKGALSPELTRLFKLVMLTEGVEFFGLGGFLSSAPYRRRRGTHRGGL
ncbi:MAG: hypothetical protein ACE5IA_00505 [Dehalococcoidia bacterium]